MTTWVGAPFQTHTGNAPTTQQLSDWINAFHQACLGVGLIQTADTGQLDPLNPPAWPGGQGYQTQFLMYRMNDSQQATDPVFIKVQFGRAGTPAGGCMIQCSYGQGTNGAGTLTGATAVMGSDGGGPNGGGTIATVQTYMCAGEGYWFWGDSIGYPYGAAGRTFGGFNRSRNPSTYAFDSTGIICWGNTTVQADYRYRGMYINALKWSGLSAAASNSNYAIMPGYPASSALLNGDKQLYPHFYTWPDVRQNWATFTTRQTEVAGTNPVTFSARPLLSGPSRTFINYGSNAYGNVTSGTYLNDYTMGWNHIWE